mmetsp:Transcript_5801/g.14461  ORF Transcript_5801/g.14461 Transcript_5801/m.14461 type:complete len:314 (+) Transcript_5801:958-1899(+)
MIPRGATTIALCSCRTSEASEHHFGQRSLVHVIRQHAFGVRPQMHRRIRALKKWRPVMVLGCRSSAPRVAVRVHQILVDVEGQRPRTILQRFHLAAGWNEEGLMCRDVYLAAFPPCPSLQIIPPTRRKRIVFATRLLQNGLLRQQHPAPGCRRLLQPALLLERLHVLPHLSHRHREGSAAEDPPILLVHGSVQLSRHHLRRHRAVHVRRHRFCQLRVGGVCVCLLSQHRRLVLVQHPRVEHLLRDGVAIVFLQVELEFHHLPRRADRRTACQSCVSAQHLVQSQHDLHLVWLQLPLSCPIKWRRHRPPTNRGR